MQSYCFCIEFFSARLFRVVLYKARLQLRELEHAITHICMLVYMYLTSTGCPLWDLDSVYASQVHKKASCIEVQKEVQKQKD